MASSSKTKDQPRALPQDEILTRIRDIIPDVSHDFAIQIYAKKMEGQMAIEDRIQYVINYLMEHPGYPKRTTTPHPVDEAPVDLGEEARYKLGLERWMSTTRPAPDPVRVSTIISLLSCHFPQVGMRYLRYVQAKNLHLAPTWLHIEEQLGRNAVTLNKTKRGLSTDHDYIIRLAGPELEDEMKWLNLRSSRLHQIQAEEALEEHLQAMDEQSGSLLECQCCFDSFRFVKVSSYLLSVSLPL